MMSIASSPDFLVRPEDKAFRMLFSSTEDTANSSFDEFLNKEIYDNIENEFHNDPFIDTEVFFNSHSYTSTNKDIALTVKDSETGKSSPQPWRKGLWCLDKDRTSQLVIEKTRKGNSGTLSYVSPVYLIGNKDFALRSPRSTTLGSRMKDLSPTPKASTRRLNSARLPPEACDVSLPSDKIYSPLLVKTIENHSDDWQQEFQNFKLELSDDNSLPSPRLESGRVSNGFMLEQSNVAAALYQEKPQLIPRAVTMHHYNRDVSEMPLPPLPNTSTRLGDLKMSALSGDKVSSPVYQNQVSAPGFHFLGHDQWAPPCWTTESLHSSDSSHHSQLSYHSHESQKDASHCNIWQPGWASPINTKAVERPPLQTAQDYHPVILQPIPQRVRYQRSENHATLPNGLGIHSTSIDNVGIAVPYQVSDWHLGKASHSRNPARVHALTSYPPLPPPVPQDFNDSLFSTPRRRVKSASRSPSPPISPTNVDSRSLRQRSPTRSDYNQHRRKSIHKTGPLKEGGYDSSRNRSASRPPRTPKTPKTPTGGFGQIGFVNFTPKDAVKLLSDVAPSGSSKTRARREQEAREKRKRLGEAALQAVRKAGGDVSALEEAFLHGHVIEDEF